MSPLASRDPIFFARLEAGRPILVPGDGLPVRAPHPRRRRRPAHGVRRRQPRRHRPGVQRRRHRGPSVIGIIAVHGPRRRHRGRHRPRAVGDRPPPQPAPRALGRGHHRRHVFSVDKALHDLDWRPQFGLEAGYRDSYAWFRDGGRDRYEFDFSADDAVLALLRMTPSSTGALRNIFLSRRVVLRVDPRLAVALLREQCASPAACSPTRSPRSTARSGMSASRRRRRGVHWSVPVSSMWFSSRQRTRASGRRAASTTR